MQNRNQLVRQRSGELVSAEQQLKPQELLLIRELALTADNSKTDIGPELQAEFMRVFEAESPLLLERAFQSWRLRSNFVPTVREIYQLIEEEAMAAYQEREQEAWDRWREEARAARETWLDPKQKTALDEICADLGKRLKLARMNNLPQKRERIDNVVARSQAKALRAIGGERVA